MTSKKQVIDFRSMARAALARARVQLASRNSDHLRYAALELRMAMEALTYGKAQAYEAELQPEDYETWQPQKLLQQILEIDPHADVCSATIWMEESGDQGGCCEPLGWDDCRCRLTLARGLFVARDCRC